MKKIILLLALGFAGYYGYQKYYSNGLYGEWQLDTDATEKQLVQAGASKSLIEAFRQQLGNGRTGSTISKDRISFIINNDRVDFPYEIIGRKDDCTTIKFETGTFDFCVRGSTLEVHNPQKANFEVYKRL